MSVVRQSIQSLALEGMGFAYENSPHLFDSITIARMVIEAAKKSA